MHLMLLFFCATAVFSSIFALRNGGLANCCPRFNPERVHVKQIVSYWRQNNRICQIEAIVFTLENGNFLCSDPNLNWTKKAMRKVDEEAEQNQSSGLVLDASQDNREGLVKTMLTLASRWPQMPASMTISRGRQGANSSTEVKSSKPRRGPKKRFRIIKKKKRGRNQGGKGNQLVTKQPVFNLTSFTTYPYK